MTLADGRTVVSWCNGKNAGDSDIFALFLNANRAVEGAPVQLNLTADNQSKPNACPPLQWLLRGVGILRTGLHQCNIYSRIFDVNGKGGEQF